MGKKYIIELLDDCPSEFKGIIVFGLTPEGQISAEPIPVEDLTPYTEPDLEQVKSEAYNDGYKAGREAEEIRQKLRQPDLEQVRKEAYEQGRKDGKIEGQVETWVCVKKIAFNPESVECVDDLVRKGFDVGDGNGWSEAIEELFEKYSAAEAIAKIKAWEDGKQKINVGDEVEAVFGRAVVIEILGNNKSVIYMYHNASTGVSGIDKVTKTGRHFPEIAEVLQKMKETNNG